MITPKKQASKVYMTTDKEDIALMKRLKRLMLPSAGKLTNTALLRIALRQLAKGLPK